MIATGADIADRGALMVCGATSGAGKSTVTAALCRVLARRGGHVAPFKAQNMSNHAAVTADGGEVGRAQAMQARAAGVDLSRAMNPVLLKPTTDQRSHVVVMGDEIDTTDAQSYGSVSSGLRDTVLDALTHLRRTHDWVIAEGAGGAAEINLLERDLVNLPLARAAGLPVVLVVDIDRGGAFASAFGTLELVPPELKAQVVGVVFNMFRGDPALLTEGHRVLEARTGVPVLGVLPHLGPTPLLGVEDSLDITAASGASASPALRVAAVRLPHLANPSDLDPLASEPGVDLRWVHDPGAVVDADLVVLPGSRATVADLDWVREQGIADALVSTPASVVGLCAGYQMLGEWIDDPVESGRGRVAGLGLLDVTTTFEPSKLVRRRTGTVAAGGPEVSGYEIRFGRPTVGARPWLRLDGEPEGALDATGRIAGTSLHGVFDDDAMRWSFLRAVAERQDREFQPGPTGYGERLDAQQDRLADWLAAHVDLERLLDSGRSAAPPEAVPGW